MGRFQTQYRIFAKIEIDVRYLDESSTSEIIDNLRKVASRTYVVGTNTKIKFVNDKEVLFKPMAKTKGNIALFNFVSQVSEELSFDNPPPSSIISGVVQILHIPFLPEFLP